MSVIRIAGTGSVVPPRVVTNGELHKIYPGTKGPEWILDKTGIRERRWGMNPATRTMDDEWYDTDLAEKAARLALANASITADALDLIVYVGCTFEHIYFPDSACALHQRLGASPACVAYTVQGGCGALVYQLWALSRMLWGTDNRVRRALLVASNTTSSFVPGWSSRLDDAVMKRDGLALAVFGDGASALVLERSNAEDEQGTILATWAGADHERDPMEYRAGGSRYPTTKENVDDHGYGMNARDVFVMAPRLLWRATQGLQSTHSFAPEEVSYFLFHQANLRILEGISQNTGMPMEKILVNIDRYGNTAAASIGILLDEAVRSGKIQRGNLLCLLGVGAGWQYGGILVRW